MALREAGSRKKYLSMAKLRRRLGKGEKKIRRKKIVWGWNYLAKEWQLRENGFALARRFHPSSTPKITNTPFLVWLILADSQASTFHRVKNITTTGVVSKVKLRWTNWYGEATFGDLPTEASPLQKTQKYQLGPDHHCVLVFFKPKDSLAFYRVRTHGNVAHLHAYCMQAVDALKGTPVCNDPITGFYCAPQKVPYLVSYSAIIIHCN